MKNQQITAPLDKDMEQKASFMEKENQTLRKALNACENLFREISKGEPEQNQDQWRWLIDQCYDKVLKLTNHFEQK